MKNSFFSFLFFGLFLTALISFADDPQDINKKSNKRSNKTTIGDTSATRRIQHNTNQPRLQKTDSLPMPKPTPVPPVPRPDTVSNGMMR
jgi:hypothetical protein